MGSGSHFITWGSYRLVNHKLLASERAASQSHWTLARHMQFQNTKLATLKTFNSTRLHAVYVTLCHPHTKLLASIYAVLQLLSCSYSMMEDILHPWIQKAQTFPPSVSVIEIRICKSITWLFFKKNICPTSNKVLSATTSFVHPSAVATSWRVWFGTDFMAFLMQPL